MRPPQARRDANASIPAADADALGAGEPAASTPAHAQSGLPPLASGRRRLWLGGVVANHLLQTLLALATAFAAKALVDDISRSAASSTLVQISQGFGASAAMLTASAVIALLVLAGLLRGLELAQAEALAQHYIAHLRSRLFERLVTLSPDGRLRRSRGGVMLRFVGDVQALRGWVGHGIAQCVAAAFALIALIAGLAAWQPQLALWAIAWMTLAGALMCVTLPALGRAIRDSRRRQAAIASNVFDRIATLAQLQASGTAAREKRRLQRQNRQLRQSMQRRAWTRARHRWAIDLCLAGLALSLLGTLVTHPSPNGGLLVGAMGLLGLLTRPLRGIGIALESREAARVARERMVEFLNEPGRLRFPLRGTEPGARPTLRFDQVGVPRRLQAFSATLPFGRRVAVCGPAGSGKSTLLTVAARLREPATGEVRLDDHPLGDLSDAALRRCISFVSSEPALIRGTVRRCLQQRHATASDAELLAACVKAGWVDADETTLDTLVRDDGANLSGQRRRQLALAIALVGNPRVLVIDDAEQALPGDPVKSLAALLKVHPGSLLFSTADPRLAQLADDIWWPAPELRQSRAAASASTDPAALRLVGLSGSA